MNIIVFLDSSLKGLQDFSALKQIISLEIGLKYITVVVGQDRRKIILKINAIILGSYFSKKQKNCMVKK